MLRKPPLPHGNGPVSLQNRARKKAERGATILLFTFCTMTLVIPMIGLAIDGSVAMWTKAKLSAAVDAAALAAGRSMTSTGSFADQQAMAKTVATNWFHANFPIGWLNTTLVSGPTVDVEETGKTITSSVQASVSAPLFFMRIFGPNFQRVTVSASAISSRRNLVLVLVLDRSGSMSQSGSCGTMVADAQSFVNFFTDGFDTLGLVTFSSTANLDYTPSLDFKPGLSDTIGNIQCTGATSTTQALNVAYSALVSAGEPGALNVIVLFTDGQPNTILSKDWPINSGGSCSGTGVIPGTIAGAITTVGTDSNATPYGIYDPSKSGNLSPLSPASSYNATNCLFETNGLSYIGGESTRRYNIPADIASIPSQDVFGNLTTGYQPNDLTFNGPNIVAASFNSADDQAYKIRHDATLQPMIFTIGLGAGVGPTEQEFLERLANDPRSTSYEPSLAAGTFVYAPDASELQTAFYQIASEILRLSQ